MGTRMLLYEIEKDKWWEFADKVLKFYLEDSYLANITQNFVQKKRFDKFFVFLHDTNNHVEIQVFEYENKYMFRVLETGYYFYNNYPEKFPYLKTHFYDDHSDVDESMEEEYHWIDWMDEKIYSHHYWVFPIIDENSFNLNELMREEE